MSTAQVFALVVGLFGAGCGGENPVPNVPAVAAPRVAPTSTVAAARTSTVAGTPVSVPDHLFARLYAGELASDAPKLPRATAKEFSLFAGAAGLTWVLRGSVLYRGQTDGALVQEPSWMKGLPVGVKKKAGDEGPLVPISVHIAGKEPAEGDLISFGDRDAPGGEWTATGDPWKEGDAARPWRHIEAVFQFTKGAWIHREYLTVVGGYADGEMWRPVNLGDRGTLLVPDLHEPEGTGLPNLTSLAACRKAGLRYIPKSGTMSAPLPNELTKLTTGLCIRDAHIDAEFGLFVVGYSESRELKLGSEKLAKRISVEAKECATTSDPRLGSETLVGSGDARTNRETLIRVRANCVRVGETPGGKTLRREKLWSVFSAKNLIEVQVVGGLGLGSRPSYVEGGQVFSVQRGQTGKSQQERLEVWNAAGPLLAVNLQPPGWGIAVEEWRSDHAELPSSGAYLFYLGDRGKNVQTARSQSDPSLPLAGLLSIGAAKAARESWWKRFGAQQ